MNGLSVTLGADISALKRSLDQAVGAVRSSAGRMSGIAAAGMTAGVAAALAGGAAAVGVAVKAVSSAADFEQTKVAFTTLIGDADKAQKTLADLRQFGNETPFQFPELADAGRKLIAFGEGSDTVVATLRRIGDVSAGIQAPIGEIAEIYGKARVQGRLFAEDINQLTGRGVPVIGELARQFGVNESQVRKLVESGKVGFPQIEQAFVNMTSKGGKFYGMMDAQSKTTKGLWSTLKDTFGDILRTLGQPINDAIRPLVAQAIDLTAKLVPMATAAGVMIRDSLFFVIGVFKSGQFGNLVGGAMKFGFAEAVNFLFAALRGILSALGQAPIEVCKNAVMMFNVLTTPDFWYGMGNALIGVALQFTSFMQKGMAQVLEVARPLADLFGQGDLVDFAQGALQASAAELEQMAEGKFQKSGEQLGPIVDAAFQRIEAMTNSLSAKFADTFKNTPDLIDTTGMLAEIAEAMQAIKDATPKPTEVEVPKNQPTGANGKGKGDGGIAEKLAPIVTTLGRVGGGGYSSGTLDAQRENNRLTGQTNSILNDIRGRLTGGNTRTVAAFG